MWPQTPTDHENHCSLAAFTKFQISDHGELVITCVCFSTVGKHSRYCRSYPIPSVICVDSRWKASRANYEHSQTYLGMIAPILTILTMFDGL